MPDQSLGLRTATALLLLFSAVVLWGVAQKKARLDLPPIATATSLERRQTLDALKAAWSSRPGEPTPDHARTEKDFINRTAAFLDRVARHDIRPEAHAFYQRIVTDFFDRYGSEAGLDRR